MEALATWERGRVFALDGAAQHRRKIGQGGAQCHVMIPYQDTVATRYPPLAVWGLLAVNIVVFVHQVSLPAALQERFIATFALVPARYFGALALLAPPTTPADWLPFFTNMFLHAGWLHLGVNMWTLWIFGRAVEDRLGAGRFLGFFIACGLAASVAHAVLNPDSVVPALGASGAIAGVIGCYARMFPFARLVMIVPIVIVPLFVEVSAIAFALVWFVLQIVPGLLALGQDTDAGGIAWWAHVGGFVAGVLLAPLVRRPQAAYRPYYPDEGICGFMPDGRRRRGRGPWG